MVTLTYYPYIDILIQLYYPLVIYRWPIEIDDFPSERNLHLWLGFSMAMLNNQMVYIHIIAAIIIYNYNYI